MGPELLPLLVAGAGTAASIYAANEQADERRKTLNQQLERDDAASKKNAQMVLDQGQRYTQANRDQALTDAESKTYDQTQADLAGAGGANIATAADNSNVSEDFVKTKAARALDEGNRLSTIARQAAKVRAPGQVGLDDSLSLARLGNDTSNLWGTTRNMAGANALDAESVQEPWYGALGKVAQAAGGAMAAGGYGRGSGINWDADGSYSRKYAAGAGR